MNGDDVTQRLRELAQRHADGLISSDDYARQKQALLGSPGSVSEPRETLMIRAVPPADPEPSPPRTRPGRTLLPLVIAVGVVIVALIAVVLLTGTGLR